MNDINKEKDLSQENEEKLDSNLATIKSYLEANGIDSSWVEKSSYMKDNFSRGTSPFEYTVFYFDEKSNELKSRIKDVRGPSDKNSERKFTFYEYGNVVAMESLNKRVLTEQFQADKYFAAGDYDDDEPDRYQIKKNICYFDKVDGNLLVCENRKSHEHYMNDEDKDIVYYDAEYEVKEEEIEKKLKEFPREYAFVGNIMQIKRDGIEKEKLKKDNDSLRKMLDRTLKFAEKIKDSRIGYWFFRKDINEVLGVKNKEAKRLEDGHSGQGEDSSR